MRAAFNLADGRRMGLGSGLIVDLLRSARYDLAAYLQDSVAVAGTRLAARWDRLRGRPEAALLRHGEAVYRIKRARESLASYRAMETLVEAHPERLAGYRMPPVQPDRMVFFIGYSRSGHSLVGSLLDAHPNVVVSHEVHALKMMERGGTLPQVLAAIQYNATFFSRFGRGYNGYDYRVASQSQGQMQAIRLIGDKKANGTCGLLRRDPAFVDRLLERLPVPVSFVHVIRDPFDNIASRAQRVGVSPALASLGYLVNVDVIAQLKSRHPGLVIDVHLDDLSRHPRATLGTLIAKLGLEAPPEDYFEACAALVFDEPRRTRSAVTWPAPLVASLRERLAAVDFLARYADGAL